MTGWTNDGVTVPDFQTIMLPLLQFAVDGEEHSVREAASELADRLELSQEQRESLLPSGTQTKFYNRVCWSGTYLRKAGLLESTGHGCFRITDLGQSVLAQSPPKIDMGFLQQFESYREFRKGKKEDEEARSTSGGLETAEETPEETLDAAYKQVRAELASDVLTQMKGLSPKFFEKLVLELLVKMGYGGSLEDAAQTVGRSGDEGIDGVIKEDRLGLDTIYIQAKRWENSVGRPEIQKFVGALQGFRARKGVFMTTSNFTSEAKQYAQSIDVKVVLLDGEAIANLMIDCDLGVSATNTYELKRIDSDYFQEL